MGGFSDAWCTSVSTDLHCSALNSSEKHIQLHDDATQEEPAARSNGTLNYTCAPGYRFGDGSEEGFKLATCQAGDVYEPAVSKCYGAL